MLWYQVFQSKIDTFQIDLFNPSIGRLPVLPLRVSVVIEMKG